MCLLIIANIFFVYFIQELEESRLKVDELSKLKIDLSAQVEELNESLHVAPENSTVHEVISSIPYSTHTGIFSVLCTSTYIAFCQHAK